MQRGFLLRFLSFLVLPALAFGILACPVSISHAAPAGAEEPSSSLILGKVIDSQNGSPLSFATLALTRIGSPEDTTGTPAGGALTKADGSYRIQATPGLYRIVASYVSYSSRKITGIRLGSSTCEVMAFG